MTGLWHPVYPDGLPIGEEWVAAPASEPVRFPYDGSLVAEAPIASAELATRAIDEALAVRTSVAGLPSHVRQRVLIDTHDALAARREEMEQLIVLESGKPLVDCRVEVDRALLTLRTAAEQVPGIHGETVPLDMLPSGEGLVGFWVRKPIGVVVGIAGFNFPLLLSAHKVAPALAAGCPIVVKPAPQTPLATLWLVHEFRQALAAAGAPVAACQLVTGGPDVGRALTTDERIGLVSFTGSAAVGHAIARDAAPTKVVLELGSNSALVVAADADLDAAADAVARGGYYASGQACIAVQRVLVEQAVHDDFLGRLTARLAGLQVGDPRDPDTRVSALIDPNATTRVLEWVGEAVDAGARVATGGTESGGMIAPTVLLDVEDGQRAWDEELFGPVVAVRPVADMAEAFDIVNHTRYGLHASVFTSSLATAFDALDRLEVGGVVVNEVPGFRSDVMPYGGVKDSGIGREGPRFAIEEMTVTRMAIMRPHPKLPAAAPPPASPAAGSAAAGSPDPQGAR